MREIVVAGRGRAVQYLRMSTEHQRYSLENQETRIAEYAAEHGYDVVGTYADAGRSGLTLKERKELNRLLRDVTDPARSFSTILVLDVSRWGRFQDPDQHAAYEFICRDLGVRVEYVAEAFLNDGSFASSMLKHMKRIMAGEFSRELSAKVAYGQLRGARRGQKQGGPVGIGLRRLLVDGAGQPKYELAVGEWKALATDKVVVVPGPIAEQDVVRRLFDLFIEGATFSGIARHLNHVGAPSTGKLPWSPQKVKSALTNEQYTGVYVYNKWSQKLKTPSTMNPPSLWVRVPMCEGIISKDTFQKAQERLATRPRGSGNTYDAEKMLAGLRRLLAEQGRLSVDLINTCPYVPHWRTYEMRFGPTKTVYELIGYTPKPPPKVRRPQRSHRYSRKELLAQLKRVLREHGYLSLRVIDQCNYTASFPTYARAFGSFENAYRAAGYEPLAPRFEDQNYDREKALQKLKVLFAERGPITDAKVCAAQAIPTRRWYREHFGSLARACAQANVPYEAHTPVTSRTFAARNDFLNLPAGGQAPIYRGTGEISDDDLRNAVRRIYEQYGYVNKRLITLDLELPSIQRIREHYAKLSHLYAAAGLPADMSSRKPRKSALAAECLSD